MAETMTNDTDAPRIDDMIGASVGDRSDTSDTALHDLHIQLKVTDDSEPSQTVPLQVEETAPRRGPGRPRGSGTGVATTPRKSVLKADLVRENDELRAKLAAVESDDIPQRRKNVGTMISMLAIMLYGGLAEWRDMPHYALEEDEAKEIGEAFTDNMPAHHLAAVEDKVPYAMPAVALLSPLMRGILQEMKLRRKQNENASS